MLDRENGIYEDCIDDNPRSKRLPPETCTKKQGHWLAPIFSTYLLKLISLSSPFYCFGLIENTPVAEKSAGSAQG